MTRRRLAIGSSLALVIALAIGVRWALNATAPPIRRAEAAFSQGDWEAASKFARAAIHSEPANGEARLLLARALARRNEPTEALRAYADAPVERLTADDLVQIGEALGALGRPVLALAALDGATKLGSPSVLKGVSVEALNQGLLGVMDGARQVDQLSAVSDGHAVAALVLGLVEMTDAFKPAAPGEFVRPLDRIGERERTDLARIASADDARRLLAELSLEEGRTEVARRWLGKVSGTSDDPEVKWLLGRVALAEGKIEEASADPFPKRPGGSAISPEPCRYVGAKACAECHGAIYRSQRASRHAMTVASGDDLATVLVPPGELDDPSAPGVVHSFVREGGLIKVEAKGDDSTVRGVVEYVIGSGHHGTTMVLRDDQGQRRSARISYYAGGDHWGLTSGFPPNPSSPHDRLGEALDEPTFRDCLHCHSTRHRSDRDRQGPEAAERGIGCERCHGPGESHLKAVESGFPDLAIARPKVATPSERAALCARCHAADGKIPPSDPRFIRFQSTTLPFSRCVTESGGKLDCVACHDPHANAETDPTYYEARCLACHDPERRPLGPAIRLEPVAASACPVNPSKGCLGCHMPKVPDVLPFTSFTDHHVRVRREAPSGPCPTPEE